MGCVQSSPAVEAVHKKGSIGGGPAEERRPSSGRLQVAAPPPVPAILQDEDEEQKEEFEEGQEYEGEQCYDQEPLENEFSVGLESQDGTTLIDRITTFYEKYDPKCVADAHKVAQFVENNPDKLELLNRELYNTYGAILPTTLENWDPTPVPRGSIAPRSVKQARTQLEEFYLIISPKSIKSDLDGMLQLFQEQGMDAVNAELRAQFGTDVASMLRDEKQFRKENRQFKKTSFNPAAAGVVIDFSQVNSAKAGLKKSSITDSLSKPVKKASVISASLGRKWKNRMSTAQAEEEPVEVVLNANGVCQTHTLDMSATKFGACKYCGHDKAAHDAAVKEAERESVGKKWRGSKERKGSMNILVKPPPGAVPAAATIAQPAKKGSVTGSIVPRPPPGAIPTQQQAPEPERKESGIVLKPLARKPSAPPPAKKTSVVSDSLSRKWKKKQATKAEGEEQQDVQVEYGPDGICKSYTLDMNAAKFGACKWCGRLKAEHGAAGSDEVAKAAPETSNDETEEESVEIGRDGVCSKYALDMNAAKFGACKHCGKGKALHGDKPKPSLSSSLARKWKK